VPDGDPYNADTINADLTDINLSDADLTGADLSGADVTRAILGRTIFGRNNLRETIGLDSPSTIGLDTFFRSEGRIPEFFLRGAGVPDIFIQYAASLTGAAFEFYSCFINYSGKDDTFVQRLYADLQAKGVRRSPVVDRFVAFIQARFPGFNADRLLADR
jgi:uncharacterized protein YjbI with pentapeptide repeats